jgi:hypothetical protein
MIPVDSNTVLDRPESEEIAAVQPQLRVADPYQKVKFFSQGRDFSKDALMVILKGDNVQPVAGKVPVDLIPQVHKGLAGIQDGAADAKGCAEPGLLFSGLGQRLLRAVKKFLRIAVNDPSRGGQPDPLVGPVQQLQIQMLFQRIELLHHRWGRNVKFFRRFIKTAAIGNSYKCFQLRIEHCASLRSSLIQNDPYFLLVHAMLPHRFFHVKETRSTIQS